MKSLAVATRYPAPVRLHWSCLPCGSPAAGRIMLEMHHSSNGLAKATAQPAEMTVLCQGLSCNAEGLDVHKACCGLLDIMVPQSIAVALFWSGLVALSL